MNQNLSRQIQIREVESQVRLDSLAKGVDDGLSASRKTLPSRFFYDAVGSELFEQICDLPSYYVTRAEAQIFKTHAPNILDGFVLPCDLAEFGSGSAVKTRLLIEHLLSTHGTLRYIPIDISRDALEQSAKALTASNDDLEVFGIVDTYERGLQQLQEISTNPKWILFLGSSIGNFTEPEAVDFLLKVRRAMALQDRLLIGFDICQQADVLKAAYDDPEGVTALFNKNLLTRINTRLGGQFELEDFAHEAFFNPELSRVEMHLVSQKDQEVYIQELNKAFSFAKGETIHTENSYKYSLPQISSIAQRSGFSLEQTWKDDSGRFALCQLVPNPT